MSTLQEIEQAVATLEPTEQRLLLEWLTGHLQKKPPMPPAVYSVLDIPPISVGRLLVDDVMGDDLLGEMLEDRKF